MLGVDGTGPFNSWGKTPSVTGTAEQIAAGLDEAAWQRLSAGEGTKGPRLHDWVCSDLTDHSPISTRPTDRVKRRRAFGPVAS